MEITQELLGKKRQEYDLQLKEAREQMTIWATRVRKLEGAMEATQWLITNSEKELKEELKDDKK